MRSIFVSAIVLALAGDAASTQGPRGRLIGSVEIPALHDAVNKESRTTRSNAVTLYKQPRNDAELATTIENRSEIESLEHGYEQVSAGVLDVQNKVGQAWYLIQYKRENRLRPAWLSGRDAGRFRRLSEILHGRAYLTKAWDGHVYKAPHLDASRQSVSQAISERRSVLVADSAGEEQQLWFLVVVVDGTICDGGSRSVLAAGWVPAHSTSGQLNVWHHSRGC